MWCVRVRIAGAWIYARNGKGAIAHYADRLKADRVAWKLCAETRITAVEVVERRTVVSPDQPPRMRRIPQ